MEQESKSISQSDLLSPYDEECPHCALTRFANLWQDHQDCNSAELLEGVLELLADILVTVPEAQKSDVINSTMIRIVRDFASILRGDYKPDQLAALQAKTEGRLQ